MSVHPVTGNVQSKLFLSMLGAFAECERAQISERIKATKQRQIGVAPFGRVYDDAKRLVPVPEQQAVIRRIRRLGAKGLSPHKMAATYASGVNTCPM